MSTVPTEAPNPFGPPAVPGGDAAVVQVEQERAIQEVKAAMVIAKQFPRDPRVAMDRILQACARPTLAENAMYSYPRGGSVITGPSIRLAEAMAQNWGNIQFGVMELSQSRGESSVMAIAWDLETNTKQFKTFTVPHVRYTRAGVTHLEDPRDVYEMVANQAARRLRACILGVIPGDVIDAAVKQCEVTVSNAMGAPEEEVEKMVAVFEAEFGVTKEQIAKRLGHHLNATIAAEVLQLRKIYASLRDGMAKVSDFFDADDPAADLAKSLKKETDAAPPPADEKTDVNPVMELIGKLKEATTLDEVDELEDQCREMPAKARNKVKGAAADARARLES
jgi:hypothetical protein